MLPCEAGHDRGCLSLVGSAGWELAAWPCRDGRGAVVNKAALEEEQSFVQQQGWPQGHSVLSWGAQIAAELPRDGAAAMG